MISFYGELLQTTECSSIGVITIFYIKQYSFIAMVPSRPILHHSQTDCVLISEQIFFLTRGTINSSGSRNFQRKFQVEEVFNNCQGQIQTF